MAINTPTFPVASFKDSQTLQIQELYHYFDSLYHSYCELSKQVCNVRRDINTLSDNFARGDISPFLFGRFLTKSENSLSDSINHLASLNDSLIDTSNKLFDLLPLPQVDPAEPTCGTPTDSSTKH